MKQSETQAHLFKIVIMMAVVLLTTISATPIQVTEDNWENLLATDEWMVEFYVSFRFFLFWRKLEYFFLNKK